MISFGVGALPNDSPAACHTPKGGPDSINLIDALRNTLEAPDEFRDLVVAASPVARLAGAIGEYVGSGESFSLLLAILASCASWLYCHNPPTL